MLEETQPQYVWLRWLHKKYDIQDLGKLTLKASHHECRIIQVEGKRRLLDCRKIWEMQVVIMLKHCGKNKLKKNIFCLAHPLPSFLHPGIFDVVIHVDPPPNPSEYFSRSLIATLYSFVLLAVVQRDLLFCSCLSWRRYRDILDISGPCLFLRQ